METHYTPEQARRYIANKWPEKLGRPTGVPTWTAEGGTIAVVDAAGWCPEAADDYARHCFDRVRMERGDQPPGEWQIMSRLSERSAEEHDLVVLANLYELMRWVAGQTMLPAAVVEEGGKDGEDAEDAEDAEPFLEGDGELGKYLRPLRRPHLRTEVSTVAEQLGKLCGFWGAVHQRMDEHWGTRRKSRRPLIYLVKSLWNHKFPGVKLTETEISMVLMGLDVPDIPKTVAPGFEGQEGVEAEWFTLRTVRNVVRKSVQALGGSKRRRKPKE